MTPSKAFTRVEPSIDLPSMESDILILWREIDAFSESVRRRPADREYVFYDGPPFPTGSPHYGNLLAGVIKDVVPRYWTMRGYRVERRFGWDTHGLPIEMEVEKELGISGPQQIAEFGIDRFNEACRVRVQANTEAWETLTERIGRWVDFENDYKTMDTDFMETVWWVFRQLWDKGLIYRDFKVLPYSWGAATPLSNFEANLDYRDVEDPSITIRVPVIEGVGPVQSGDFLLLWTTTPWTLPANLAIAVGDEHSYVRVKDKGIHYWIGRDQTASVFGDSPTVVDAAQGSDLIGTTYEPPFDYFGEERDKGAFRVIPSEGGRGRGNRPGAHGTGLREGRLLCLAECGHLGACRPGRRRWQFHRRSARSGWPQCQTGRRGTDTPPRKGREAGHLWSDNPQLPVLLPDRHSPDLQGHPHLVRRS